MPTCAALVRIGDPCLSICTELRLEHGNDVGQVSQDFVTLAPHRGQRRHTKASLEEAVIPNSLSVAPVRYENATVVTSWLQESP
jgi:hypothetical protein